MCRVGDGGEVEGRAGSDREGETTGVEGRAGWGTNTVWSEGRAVVGWRGGDVVLRRVVDVGWGGGDVVLRRAVDVGWGGRGRCVDCVWTGRISQEFAGDAHQFCVAMTDVFLARRKFIRKEHHFWWIF